MQFSDLYLEYKNEFIQNCANLDKLSLQRDSQLFEKLIEDNETLLKQISVQMCSLGARQSSEQLKLKPYRVKFNSLKKLFSTQKENSQEKTGKKIQVPELEQNDKLAECKQLLFEAEDHSNSISLNLHDQTNKMEGMNSKLKKVDGKLSSANDLVSIMMFREKKRSMVVYLTIISVILTILVVKFGFS